MEAEPNPGFDVVVDGAHDVAGHAVLREFVKKLLKQHTLKPLPEKGAKLIAVVEQSGQPLNNSGDRAERTFSVL